jgi:acid stress chaperone HdeB
LLSLDLSCCSKAELHKSVLNATLVRNFLEAAVMHRINAIFLIMFLAAPAARAQVTIEVSKITCEQYLSFSVADPRDINIWLSGYYHGKEGTTVFEPHRLRETAEKLKAECLAQANSKLPVMQVMQKVLGSSK